MRTSLSSQLAADIQRYIVDRQFAQGDRLPERALAAAFRVSRSPIRAALGQLADRAIVEPHPDGGFVVRANAAPPQLLPAADENEDVYLRIAHDRFGNVLPERVTENALMRRYGVTRSQLAPVLRRISQEGWVERLPGHGWAFSTGMTSPVAYAQGYRFRMLVEPAGILEPTYAPDRAGLERCAREQQFLADGAVHAVSPAQIFDANTRLHETIAASSGNRFIVDALQRLNRVRRLMEYRKAIDRGQAHRRCQEHVALIALLLDDQREAAADFMRLHLRHASREKEKPAG